MIVDQANISHVLPLQISPNTEGRHQKWDVPAPSLTITNRSLPFHLRRSYSSSDPDLGISFHQYPLVIFFRVISPAVKYAIHVQWI